MRRGTGNSLLDQKICLSPKKAASRCVLSINPANKECPEGTRDVPGHRGAEGGPVW